MLRTDGWYDFYTIEELKESGEWSIPDYSVISRPNGFNITDRCFYYTGMVGTFNKKHAYNVFNKMIKDYPKKKFRLLYIVASQKTTIIHHS